jgi:hypothetical protein
LQVKAYMREAELRREANPASPEYPVPFAAQSPLLIEAIVPQNQ